MSPPELTLFDHDPSFFIAFSSAKTDPSTGSGRASRRVHDSKTTLPEKDAAEIQRLGETFPRGTDVRSQRGSDRVGPMRKILTGMFLLRETSSVALAHGRRDQR